MGGLRERKKQATRRALHDAAIRLAAEHGIEQLTVEAIADRAEVSRRTFSNYFLNKEDALLYSQQQRIDRLLALVAARPAREAAWEALTAAAGQLTTDADGEPSWAAEIRLLRGQPALVAKQAAMYAGAEQTLAELIRPRLAPRHRTPLHARLVAGTFLTALRIAVQHWLEQPDATLGDVLTRSLDAAQPHG